MRLPTWSRPFAWFATTAAGLMFALGLLNLFINTDKPGTWLGLLVLMPWPLFLGVRSLRRTAGQ